MSANKKLGARIKHLRESKSISLEEMAVRSGLDIDQIKKVEEMDHLPSLSPLIKIARVLGVRLGTFLDDSDEFGPVVSRRERHTKTVSFTTSETEMEERKHMEYYALSASKAGRHMEPFIIQIAPTEVGVNFVTSTHEGEEFIFCLEGCVEITYGNSMYLLEEGDSIYYDSIVAHHVHAADEQGAKILAVVYTPM